MQLDGMFNHNAVYNNWEGVLISSYEALLLALPFLGQTAVERYAGEGDGSVRVSR